MTNPRTEAVAKAMCVANGLDPDALSSSDEKYWTHHVSVAQAAEKALIEALMEPTEEMIAAGEAVCEPYTPYADPGDVFKAMLKAAGEGQ